MCILSFNYVFNSFVSKGHVWEITFLYTGTAALTKHEMKQRFHFSSENQWFLIFMSRGTFCEGHHKI
jgi:hypothetical protein